RKPVAAGLGADRGGAGDRLLLEGWVGVLVDAGGLGAFVAEPQGDRREVGAAGAKEHRVGVAECVWRHVLVVERVTGAWRRGGVFGDELLDGVCAEGLPL